jgi:hypothetical protein
VEQAVDQRDGYGNQQVLMDKQKNDPVQSGPVQMGGRTETKTVLVQQFIAMHHAWNKKATHA